MVRMGRYPGGESSGYLRKVEEILGFKLPVWRMDSNVSFMIQWALEAPSLLEWWEMWIDGISLFHMDWEKAVKVAVAEKEEHSKKISEWGNIDMQP